LQSRRGIVINYFFASLLINLLITVNFVKSENEIVVDRPRVGSSFHIHEGFASVGRMRDVHGSALGRELADKPKENDL